MVKKITLYIALIFAVISTQKANSQTVELDNGILSIQFKQENDQLTTSVFNYHNGGIKKQIPLRNSAEAYFLFNFSQLELTEDIFYSYWLEKGKEKKEENKIWSAFSTPGALQCYPSKAEKAGDKIILHFDRLKTGNLTVEWELPTGASHFNVSMKFTPSDEQTYSLGYRLFMAEEHKNVNELLLPMMWQQKRFPDKPYTLFDPQLPTPVSMIDFSKDGRQFTYGIAADLDAMPYEWPSLINRHFGMQIRDEKGWVHPSICGPINKNKDQTKTISLDFKVTIDNQNCLESFHSICQNIYGLHDYRENTTVNLTDAILNMIDLVKDDKHGGWWPRAKGFYQVESFNGASQSVPMVMMSLFHLTGDEELYKKRTVPSIEYTLSRSGWHFSPIPDSTGRYGKGKMHGPIEYFGSSFYNGGYEMTNRLMPYFKEVAFANGQIKETKAESAHSDIFAEWISLYLTEGNKHYLDLARLLADIYIDHNIINQATEDIGINPFFLGVYLPDFESLLRLYEITGEQKYLYAAKRGADILTTGIWTQPIVPNETILIHKNNKFEGDVPGSFRNRGNERYRLGYDMDPQSLNYRKQLSPPQEKQVPAWLVSNVGMGFETAAWIFRGSGKGKANRLIFQAPWTPDFLRLAKYTGDSKYEMYARNAVVGRWGNYPGYYNTGFTDCYLNPDYPLIGPDISSIYYHHIPVHLGWSIDYLISDAFLISDGQVDFPFERQYGYAYFDMRAYGHKPGKAFSQKNLWLWFKRGIVDIDNPQINYIMAHNGTDLFVIFVNQSKNKQEFTCRLSDGINSQKTTLFLSEKENGIQTEQNLVKLTLEGREISMLKVYNSGIEFPTFHQEFDKELIVNPTNLFQEEQITDQIKLKGAKIQMVPSLSNNYIWVEADFEEVSSVDFYYSLDGKKFNHFSDNEYPFEYSTEVGTLDKEFYYHAIIVEKDGKKMKSEVRSLKTED